MELRHLRYFVEVARTRNFTRAAENCLVAQSALSQQIARLEREVGAVLLDRTSRSVRITTAGEVLLPYADKMLGLAEDAQVALDALRGLHAGRLRLGMMRADASAVDLVGVLAEFHRSHPEVALTVSGAGSKEMLQAVVEARLDVAVVGVEPHDVPAPLSATLLAEDPLVAVFARDACTRPPTDVIDVADIPDLDNLIRFRPRSALLDRVDAALDRAGVSSRSALSIDQPDDMIRLAARGVGPTIVPRSTMLRTDPAVLDGTVVARLSDPLARQPIVVAHDQALRSPAVEAFLTILRRHC